MTVERLTALLLLVALLADTGVMASLWPLLKVIYRRRGVTSGLLMKLVALKLWVFCVVAAFVVDLVGGWQSDWIWLGLVLWAVVDPALTLIWWWGADEPIRKD